MTNPEILEWIRTAPGVNMNPDQAYGQQCVDLADQYAMDIFKKPWQETVGGVVGARQILDSSSDAYWIRTDNDPNNPNLIPKQGDLVVFGGSALNEWGHVAVVDTADQNGMWVIQQDGFAAPLMLQSGGWYSAKPAHRAWLPYWGPGTGSVTGWLTPRENKIVGYKPPAPATPAVAANQRVVGSMVANQRAEPNGEAAITAKLDPGFVFTAKGFVHGSPVGNSDVWFVGANSGHYIHSSTVTNPSTAGLPDLTPKAPVVASPVLADNQRMVGAEPANQRSEPSTASDANITGTLDPGFVFTAKGFVKGNFVGDNRIWFVGQNSGHYIHSSTVTNPSIGNLPDLTKHEAPVVPVTPSPAPPAPVPAPAPVVPSTPVVEPSTLVAELPCVTSVVPAHPDNYQVGNFPLKPVKYVPHQYGKPGIKLSSVKTYFAMSLAQRRKADPNVGVSSAHFGVDDNEIVQFVSIFNRAYGAGPGGNDFYQIEIIPNPGPKALANLRLLVTQLQDRLGYVLEPVLHQDVPGAKTECGDNIPIDTFRIIPLTKDIVEPSPAPDTTIKQSILETLKTLTTLIGKL